MQCAVIEFARNVCSLKGANSSEFNPDTPYPVVHLMPEQEKVDNKGGTMRLGAYRCCLIKGTVAHRAYGSDSIDERHRHRYELNSKYITQLEKAGMVMAGFNPEFQVVEMIELSNHPWFVGVQFHPEFKSRPNRPHPLFYGFVQAAQEYHQNQRIGEKSRGK